MVEMRPRSVLNVSPLASAVPILFYTAMGLSTAPSNLGILSGLFYGEILAGVTLTVIGTFYPRRTLTMAGAAFLFLVSTPLLVDGFFIFTLLPATTSLILLSMSESQKRVR